MAVPAIRPGLPAAMRHAAIILLAFVLASCSSLSLTESYDPQIEQTLNDYHVSFVSFVARMEQSAGTPEGAYDGEDARKFYSDSAGILANLVVRAEARNPQGSCIPGRKASGSIAGALAGSSDYHDSSSAPDTDVSQLVKSAAADLADGTGELTRGSCTTIILKALKMNVEILQSIHQRLKYLKPPASTIAGRLIGQTIEAGIIAEQSKQP